MLNGWGSTTMNTTVARDNDTDSLSIWGSRMDMFRQSSSISHIWQFIAIRLLVRLAHLRRPNGEKEGAAYFEEPYMKCLQHTRFICERDVKIYFNTWLYMPIVYARQVKSLSCYLCLRPKPFDSPTQDNTACVWQPLRSYCTKHSLWDIINWWESAY